MIGAIIILSVVAFFFICFTIGSIVEDARRQVVVATIVDGDVSGDTRSKVLTRITFSLNEKSHTVDVIPPVTALGFTGITFTKTHNGERWIALVDQNNLEKTTLKHLLQKGQKPSSWLIWKRTIGTIGLEVVFLSLLTWGLLGS